MSLLALTSLASATPMSVCSITPVDASCKPTLTNTDLATLRFTVSCETHSAPPGGPVSISPGGPYGGALKLLLDGVEVAGPVSPTARCGAGTFEFQGPFVAGLVYQVREDRGVVGGPIRMGPDVSALWHCFTNPDTCATAAGQVPPDLAPWLRLHACLRGQPCAPARADPLDPWGQILLEVGCGAGQREPCEWLADLAPDEGWPLVALRNRGSGPVARRLQQVQASSLRGAPVSVQWRGAQPLLSPAGEPLPPAARSADGAVVAAWSEAGLEVRDGSGKLLWGWTGRGVQDVIVRPDGLQILVRFPTMFVRVPLDGAPDRIGTAYDDRLLIGSFIEGTLVRPDGWPAVATRVSRCAPGEPESSCVSRTDLLGRFAVRGPRDAPAVLRLDGPSVGPDAVEVEVRSGAQTPVPSR